MLLGVTDMCVKHIPLPFKAAKRKVCIHYIIMCPFSFVYIHCTLLHVHLL